MKPKKIMAEQNNGDEALYNSQKDRWSRQAKHPIPLAEKGRVDNTWECGDMALYEGQQVEVIVPRGPNKTVGIILHGATKMVSERRLSKIEEHVMGGIQSLNPLNRMMQLAGISTPAIMEPVETNQLEENENLFEADPSNMFNGLMRANLAGEYKNNPDAARLATVGQIMVGLETIVDPLRQKVTPDLVNKLDAAVGLGAALLKSAQAMTKDQQE